MRETINIYHTNDLHSHFTSWPAIHAFLEERRKFHEAQGDFCLVLDIGDHADRSHPFTEGTFGKGNVALLNEAGYDAVTIGNNEGITFAKADLDQLYDDAQFPVVLANLYDAFGERPDWAKPYHIIETNAGKRIGLVGATAEFTPFYERLGWQVTDGKEAIRDAVQQLSGKVDFLICLSHLGVKSDEALAELCPELDVILGAHTHHVFQKGKWVGNTLLGAAGKFGQYIGHIQVELTHFDMTAELIETGDLPGDGESYDEQLMEESRVQLGEPVFWNQAVLEADWFNESELAELFGAALSEFAESDCALFNAGLFMKDLPDGELTDYDFHQLLPHPINPCLIFLTGEELEEVYDQSLNEEWERLELKGMGFRGKVFGKMVRVKFGMQDGVLHVGGEPVERNRKYRLMTLDMYTFGYFFPVMKQAEKTYFMPEFLRDVFREYFRRRALEYTEK